MIIKNIDTNYINVIYIIPENKMILKYRLISSNKVSYS